MRSLAHDRLLISALLVLLQVALIPDLGRVRCALRANAEACCCLVTAHAESAKSCCSSPADADDPLPQAATNDGPAGTDELCSCGERDGEPLAMAGEANHKADETAEPGAPTFAPAAERAAPRPSRREVPRDPTGPPLHVLYEVFLI